MKTEGRFLLFQLQGHRWLELAFYWAYRDAGKKSFGGLGSVLVASARKGLEGGSVLVVEDVVAMWQRGDVPPIMFTLDTACCGRKIPFRHVGVDIFCQFAVQCSCK